MNLLIYASRFFARSSAMRSAAFIKKNKFYPDYHVNSCYRSYIEVSVVAELLVDGHNMLGQKPEAREHPTILPSFMV